MKRAFLATLGFLSAFAQAAPLKVECLGEASAKRYLVYLHGFEEVNTRSREEEQNREALTKLAKELDLRIALPEGPLCPKNRYCWPAKDEAEVLATFALIQTAKTKCFADKDYSLVGFSNGGYYAFKLYKAHKDPLLKTILASSSSGLWDPGKDVVNSLSQFHLMIGDKDITRRDAEAFLAKFRKSDPKATLTMFKGGHRIDFKSLKYLLQLTEKR